jgi:hypothetical protein
MAATEARKPGIRPVRAFVAGVIGAACGMFISWFLPNISDGIAVLITLVSAALGAWLGWWTPRNRAREAAEPRDGGKSYVGAQAPDESSVRDAASPRRRRPLHS